MTIPNELRGLDRRVERARKACQDAVDSRALDASKKINEYNRLLHSYRIKLREYTNNLKATDD